MTKRRSSTRKSGTSVAKIAALAVATAATGVATPAGADEVAWTWDESGRTAAAPATASASIAASLPLTASVANDSQADTYAPDWLDSAGFDLDGTLGATCIILR